MNAPRLVLFGATAAVAIGLAAAALVVPSDRAALWLANGSWTLAALVALAGCTAAIARTRERAWGFLLAATVLWLAGQLAWDVRALAGKDAWPSAADAGWLAFAALCVPAVYRLAPASRTIRRIALLETAALVAGVVGLAFALLWEPAGSSGLAPLAKAVALAYPIAFIAVAALAFQGFLGAFVAFRSAPLLLVFAGLIVEAAAFAAWAPHLLAGSYAPGRTPSDPLWTFGLLCVGAGGALVRERFAPPEVTERHLAWRLVLPWSGLFGMLSALLVLDGREERHVLLGAVAGVAALLLGRSLLFSRMHLGLLGEARRMAAALERTNAELDAFAYSASHDLKAPLVSIQGFAAALSRRAGPALDERSRHYVDRIHANAGALQGLVTDLLAFARADHGARETTALDADRLVREVAAEVEARSGDRASIDVATGIPPVRGSATGIRQALVNLLENAVAYGGGRVAVGASLNGLVELWIEDDGPGVPEEERGRLFDLFARGTLGRETAPRGTGIGLALVKKVAESNGGSIRYEHRPDGGARFVLSLPKGAP